MTTNELLEQAPQLLAPKRAVRRSIIALASTTLGLLMLLGAAAPADAAQVIANTGTIGYVQLENVEGTCNYDGYSRRVYEKVYKPKISAARLANGSTTQLVSARAISTDMNTGQESYGNWTPWMRATTSAYTQFPDLAVSAPWNYEKEALTMEIYWYDERSKTYSGYTEIVLTKMFHVGRGVDYSLYTSC